MSKEQLLNTLCRYESKRKVNKISEKLLKLAQGEIAEIHKISKKQIKSS